MGAEVARSIAVQAFGEAVEGHLDAILALYKPGAKITLVLRHPDNHEMDFVMGSDSLDGAIEALQRSKGRAAG